MPDVPLVDQVERLVIAAGRATTLDELYAAAVEQKLTVSDKLITKDQLNGTLGSLAQLHRIAIRREVGELLRYTVGDGCDKREVASHAVPAPRATVQAKQELRRRILSVMTAHKAALSREMLEKLLTDRGLPEGISPATLQVILPGILGGMLQSKTVERSGKLFRLAK